jgi:hypothetical protein
MLKDFFSKLRHEYRATIEDLKQQSQMSDDSIHIQSNKPIIKNNKIIDLELQQ